jgi:hypothetical protein
VPELKRYSLVKPTLQTRFRIDFEWWQQNDRDWRVYLFTLLCSEHQQAFAGAQESQKMDWVDAQTAEVQPVDGVQHILITHCAKQPTFITEHTAMVDAVFRLFLANGNTPMTPLELGTHLGRSAETILKMLTGGRIYRGLRPCAENV